MNAKTKIIIKATALALFLQWFLIGVLCFMVGQLIKKTNLLEAQKNMNSRIELSYQNKLDSITKDLDRNNIATFNLYREVSLLLDDPPTEEVKAASMSSN